MNDEVRRGKSVAHLVLQHSLFVILLFDLNRKVRVILFFFCRDGGEINQLAKPLRGKTKVRRVDFTFFAKKSDSLPARSEPEPLKISRGDSR